MPLHINQVWFPFSDWSELIQGVPQGSVLGSLLFNIYLNDLFYILNDVDTCNYADDTTLNACCCCFFSMIMIYTRHWYWIIIIKKKN